MTIHWTQKYLQNCNFLSMKIVMCRCYFVVYFEHLFYIYKPFCFWCYFGPDEALTGDFLHLWRRCCISPTWAFLSSFIFSGLLCDLLWSDPDKDVQGWGENDRGVSFTFGADVVSKFLNRHDLDLICRAHQV